MPSFFFSLDVQRLSTLYDASRSELMENETHSQVRFCLVVQAVYCCSLIYMPVLVVVIV